MLHETNVSAKQEAKKNDARVPSTYGNRWRTKSYQKTTPKRTQVAGCIRLGLEYPKSMRLRTRGDFARLRKQSKKFFGTSVIINYRFGRSVLPRFGISIKKSFGKAHERNYVKRIVREAFRQTAHSLPSGIEIHVIPKPSITLSSALADFNALSLKEYNGGSSKT